MSDVSLALKNADSRAARRWRARMSADFECMDLRRPCGSREVFTAYCGQANASRGNADTCLPSRAARIRNLIARVAGFRSQAAADLPGEEIEHRWRGHIPRDEGLADAAHQDQGQPARAHLLVLTHDLEEGCGIGRLAARDVRDASRQAEGGEVRLDAGHAVVADEPQLLGQPERQADADGDGFAVQQPVGEAGPRLERMAERVAEVEQHALARFRLVAGDDAGLALHGDGDGVGQRRRVPGEHGRPVLLQPGEIRRRRRADRTWRPPRSPPGTPCGGSVASDVGVGQHQARLMEGADQVLALRRVDAGLAADGGVDLRQQRGRHLHEGHAAAHDAGGEARQIADHAAAERDHADRGARAPSREAFAQPGQGREALRRLAGWEDLRAGVEARACAGSPRAGPDGARRRCASVTMPHLPGPSRALMRSAARAIRPGPTSTS